MLQDFINCFSYTFVFFSIFLVLQGGKFGNYIFKIFLFVGFQFDLVIEWYFYEIWKVEEKGDCYFVLYQLQVGLWVLVEGRRVEALVVVRFFFKIDLRCCYKLLRLLEVCFLGFLQFFEF